MDRKEKQRLGRLAYRKNNPEKVRASSLAWRAKQRAITGYAGPWTCPKCGKTVKATGKGGHKRFCGDYGVSAFWGRVTKSEGCWLYRGHTLNTGHADLMRMRKKILAHRYSWMIHNGPIPSGQQVLHTCDTPLCVRPDHLFLGTQADNNHDRHAKGRSARGEMVKRNKINEKQAREILALKGTGPASKYTAKYGIQAGAICAIWRGDAWSYLSSI